MLCAGSASDGLTQIYISVSEPANISVSGKTQTILRGLNPATTCVLVMAGQSIGANSTIGGSFYAPTHASHIFNVNAYDGSCTLGVGPLIGTSGTGDNYQVQIADQIVSSGLNSYTDVILCPVSIAGSALHNWIPTDNLYWQYPLAAAQQLKRLGFPPTAFLWDQGTSDSPTSQATYTTELLQVIGLTSSFSAPWVIALSTMQTDFSTLSAVRAACVAVVNGTTIRSGPDLDSLGSTYRQTGNLPHFNPTGLTAAAALWYSALAAIF
jgi:hypothetical protein